MNKTMINHIENRVQSVVQCICGNIATEINKKRLPEPDEYTEKEKYAFIKSGKAKVKHYKNIPSGYNSFYSGFSYPVNPEVSKYEKQEALCDEEYDTRSLVVYQESKRLVDRAVLGLIEPKELVEALDAFAKEKY